MRTLIFCTWIALVLSGCGSTQEHRARQYSEAYGLLSTETQQRLLTGGIQQGDSRQAVYIALGPPQVQSWIADIEIWEYNARPVPAETPFHDGTVEQFVTPSSGAWSPSWSNKSGYLSLEFDDGKLSLWNYEEDGYPLTMKPGQSIVLPNN
ncbi:hypothetical protein [Cerasicoccus arenae]|uniref:Lipoprotein n=1 Tax=Cerasicoccus arenae TaxID=424488 RepID=A0A8J3D7P4_9BACT|nr:hypothetical protein [Cerasicoccus arenae]MBK1859590.1 hypothetical protein [Cerasicoccus arenae]GHB92897.1 hypothetical protein GCM10007047_05290 [Cerasicoccus arenae]